MTGNISNSYSLLSIFISDECCSKAKAYTEGSNCLVFRYISTINYYSRQIIKYKYNLRNISYCYSPSATTINMLFVIFEFCAQGNT